MMGPDLRRQLDARPADLFSAATPQETISENEFGRIPANVKSSLSLRSLIISVVDDNPTFDDIWKRAETEKDELSGEEMMILREGKPVGTLRQDGCILSNAPELQQLTSVWQKGLNLHHNSI